jgi:DNA-binding MarR family transcriptional regulator
MINDTACQLIDLLFIFKRNFLKQHPDFGIPILSLLIFRVITEEKEIRISDIALKLNVSVSTVTEYVEKLESDCIVQKITKENDRREKFINLTVKGKEMQDRYMKKFKDSILNKLSVLTEDELGVLGHNLQSIISILNKL